MKIYFKMSKKTFAANQYKILDLTPNKLYTSTATSTAMADIYTILDDVGCRLHIYLSKDKSYTCPHLGELTHWVKHRPKKRKETANAK